MAADMPNLVLQALEGQLISFSHFLGDNSRLDVLLENITEILNNHLSTRDGHLLGVDATSNTKTGTGSQKSKEDDAVRNIRTSTSRTDNLTEAIKEIKLQILAFGVFAKSCPRLNLFVQIIELIVSKMNNSSCRSSPHNKSEESPVVPDNPDAKTPNGSSGGAAFNFNDSNINNNNAPSNSKRAKVLATEARVGAGAGVLLEVDKNTSPPQSSDPKELGLQLSDEAKRSLSTLISQVNQEIETLISNNYASARSSCALLPYAKIRFRRIRVGTLELSKLVPSNSRLDLEASAAYICDKGLLFCMHHSCQTSKLVRIVLPHNSIKSVFMRTGSSEVSLQFRTGTQIGSMIRDKLGMKLENRESKGWFDPEGGATEKIIWFIGKSLPSEQVNFIKRIYHKKLTVVIPNNSPPS